MKNAETGAADVSGAYRNLSPAAVSARASMPCAYSAELARALDEASRAAARERAAVAEVPVAPGSPLQWVAALAGFVRRAVPPAVIVVLLALVLGVGGVLLVALDRLNSRLPLRESAALERAG